MAAPCLRVRCLSLLTFSALVVALLPFAGTTHAEDDQSSHWSGAQGSEVWSALLGVGDDEGLLGYSTASRIPVGELTANSFSWKDRTHTVENIVYNPDGGDPGTWNLLIDLSPPLEEGIECLALRVEDQWLNLSDARGNGRQLIWYGVELDWSVGSEISVSLREFPKDFEVRSINGWGNNPARPELGMAGARLVRLAPVSYAYALSSALPTDLPNTRLISNIVSAQSAPMPNDAGVTDMLWQWGQFLDHDISLTLEADPPEPLPIAIPASDPVFDPSGDGDRTIPFNRSAFDSGTGTGPDSPRQQINEITAFIDASNVYGSEGRRTRALRTNDGTGRLATSGEGRFLPYNEGGLDNDGGSDRTDLFVAGDIRANEQVGLTALHTLFVREHNRLAAAIAEESPELTGHEIFELARKVVGAQMQAIAYGEFLPLILGPGAIGPYAGYDPSIDPTIANEFSTAAYRFGHTMLSPILLRVDTSGAERPLSLREAFFNPSLTAEQGISGLLRGLTAQAAQELDARLVDEVRNLLFGAPGGPGRDLAALNIQRGRDHGLPSYNAIRGAYGLPPAETFADVSSDPDVQAELSLAYSEIEHLDIWTGGLAEDQAHGALVGETFRIIMADQFRRLRDGDRYWFENDPYFLANEDLLAEVHATTLADIIRRNTPIGDEIADNVFGGPAPMSPPITAEGEDVEAMGEGEVTGQKPPTDVPVTGPACEVNDLGTFGADADVELKVDGRWTTEGCDSRYRAVSDAHTYSFEVVDVGRIRVDLRSTEVDSYLYLLDEDGRRITENDDGGAGLDARIERDLLPGLYTVEATTVGGRARGSGDFSLSISRVTSCKSVHLGSLESGVDLTASGSWTLDTCGSRFVVEHPAHSYLFDLPQGGHVRIDLTSENGDPVLSVASTSAGLIAANDDGGERLNSRIERYLQPGRYLIEATTYLERDYQPLMADFTLVVHFVDEEERQRSSLLKIEEVHTPENAVIGQPFPVHYRIGNLGGGNLAEVGGTVDVYVMGPGVYERRGPITSSAERWQAGVSYHTGPQTANATSIAIAEVAPIEVTFRRFGPMWVFVAVTAKDESGKEVGFHGLWQNMIVLSGVAFDAVTVSVDGVDHVVEAVTDEEGLVTTMVSSVAHPDADVDASARARAIYAAGVQTQMLREIFERPAIAELAAAGDSEPIDLANPSSSALLGQLADLYKSAVAASELADSLAAAQAVNPTTVENLILGLARTASAQFVSLASTWSALQERVSGGEPLSVSDALALHSGLAYTERVISPALEAGGIVDAAREAELGWGDLVVDAMVDDFAARASCDDTGAGLRNALDETGATDAEGLFRLEAEMRAALPVYGLTMGAILCAIADADEANSLFLSALDIADSGEIQLLFRREQPSVMPDATPRQRLRIIVRLAEDGRIEHGVELPGGEQEFPASRYLSAEVPIGQWRISSGVEVDGQLIGTIRSRRVDDGRVELGFRDAAGEVVSPDIRYLPADLPTEVWFRSGQIKVVLEPALE